MNSDQKDVWIGCVVFFGVCVICITTYGIARLLLVK